MTDISESHIDANVPQGKLFDELLWRDLDDYFCLDTTDCRVDYEFLRNGPTQTGIAYPKYYLWVKITKARAVAEEGAVRLAVIDQKRFEVTNFLSRKEILRSPSQVVAIFPAALVEKINEKARSQNRPH